MDKRLFKIKEIIKNNDCDSFIVTNKSDIRYLSGLVSSNILLLITLDKSYVLSDSRYKYMIERQNIFEPVCVNKSIIISVSQLVKDLKLKKTIVDPNYINYKDYKILSDNLFLVDKENITNDLRIIKDQSEINNIIQAQNIAEKAFNDVLNTIKIGNTTKEIAAYLDYRMNMYGSEEPAFASIVINEEESADCHGIPSNKTINVGDFILFDFGATYNGYRCDITRTICVGNPSDEKKELYNIVLNAHLIAAKELKPGIKCKNIDKLARDYLTSAGYGDLFLHSLGHGVGIDIHEQPTLNTKCETVLKEGMVVTIEPGIYIKNKYGIRIEDTYIVTKTGCKSISNINKSLIII